MNRKIIIKAEDLNREIYSFLTEVGADMPVDWNTSTIGLVRNAVIEAYKRMGVHLEVDERPRALSPLLSSERIWEKKGPRADPCGKPFQKRMAKHKKRTARLGHVGVYG